MADAPSAPYLRNFIGPRITARSLASLLFVHLQFWLSASWPPAAPAKLRPVFCLGRSAVDLQESGHTASSREQLSEFMSSSRECRWVCLSRLCGEDPSFRDYLDGGRGSCRKCDNCCRDRTAAEMFNFHREVAFLLDLLYVPTLEGSNLRDAPLLLLDVRVSLGAFATAI